MKVWFLITGNHESLTGGYVYNNYICEGLAERGNDVIFLQAEDSLRRKLSELPRGAPLVCDSLAFPALMPHISSFKNKLNLVVLMHLPSSCKITDNEIEEIAAEEIKALNECRKVILTGTYLYNLLIKYKADPKKMIVITPGIDSYPQKKIYPYAPRNLVCISNYLPAKGYDVLFNSLAGLTDLSWEMNSFGNPDSDPDYVGKLLTIIRKNKLEQRIHMNGPVQRNELSEILLKADLFILPSYFESYGMALAEALSHGIPVISTQAGNIPETVPEGMGILIKAGDTAELRRVIRDLFIFPEKYGSLCHAAARYHLQAKSWKVTLEKFEKELFG